MSSSGAGLLFAMDVVVVEKFDFIYKISQSLTPVLSL